MARVALVLAVAGCVLLAGCSGLGISSPQSDAETDTPTISSTPSPTPTSTVTSTTPSRKAYPEPPSDLDNETVTQIVAEYEEVRLHNMLRNQTLQGEISGFDVTYMYPANATVLNRSDGGVYVTIKASYSSWGDNYVADGRPVRSLYFVNESVIRRVAALD